MHVRLRAWSLACAVAVAACAARADRAAEHGDRAGASPAEQLRVALLEHDRAALGHDPELVAGKYTRMAKNSFAFFRGTAWLRRPEPSAHVAPGTDRVAILGDPHPENVGTFVAGNGARVIDFNDFDLVGHGPYVHDVRRLALGLWIVADMADLARKQRLRVVHQVVEGYRAELQALAAGKPGIALRADSAFDGAVEELLVPPDSEADRGPEVTGAEAALVEALMRAYPPTLLRPRDWPAGFFTVRRVTREALGVASFPGRRFRVRVQGAGEPRVLELKEHRSGRVADAVALQRQLQEFPDDDPLLGWAVHEGAQFRVREVSAAQRRLDVERIVKVVKSPRWKKGDLRAFAHDLGRLLARGHARAPAADGRPPLAALVAAVGDGRGLANETARIVARHADETEADLERLRELLRTRGPLLGHAPDTVR